MFNGPYARVRSGALDCVVDQISIWTKKISVGFNCGRTSAISVSATALLQALFYASYGCLLAAYGLVFYTFSKMAEVDPALDTNPDPDPDPVTLSPGLDPVAAIPSKLDDCCGDCMACCSILCECCCRCIEILECCWEFIKCITCTDDNN